MDKVDESEKITHKEFWRNQLNGKIKKNTIPYDFISVAKTEFEKATFVFIAEKDTYLNLSKMSGNSQIRLFIIFVAIVKVLVFKYTGNKDSIIGVPLYKQEKTNELLNHTPLPLRNALTDEMTFKELVLSLRENMKETYDCCDFPIERIISELDVDDVDDKFPLFDLVAAYSAIHDDSYKEYAETNLAFTFVEKSETLELHIDYNKKLYKNSTISRLAEQLNHISKAILADANISMRDINIVSEKEMKMILEEVNNTEVSYPENKTIHQLFEDQVKRTPDNVAIKFEDEEMTYATLNGKANQVAKILRSKGVKPGDIVALMLERSLNMMVGILSILKAGAAYLPIDPDYPQNRISDMLSDTNASVLLIEDDIDCGRWILGDHVQNNTSNIAFVDREGKYVCQDFNVETVLLDRLPSLKQEDIENNIENVNRPEDLAYIIYTSGSSGKSKGVMIEHRNLVRLMFHDNMLFDFNEHDIWTMFHSYCFDFSVWEMYGALLHGGKLIIVPKLIAKDPRAFLELIQKEDITILNQTPTAFKNLINEEFKFQNQMCKIRTIIFGGEALQPKMLGRWKRRYPNTKLINMYGITETTVHVTYKEIEGDEIKSAISNIGRPIPTLQTYILNENFELLPIGVVGELCVSGKGVSRGYINNPELTHEKFIQNPYKKDERLYLSGDLARMLQNGDLEYMGRKDNQIKLRGHRIEIGEIEKNILDYDKVSEVVVLLTEDSDEGKSLVAYLLGTEMLTIADLRNHLSSLLPTYMIPSKFIQLDNMPMTPNGKIDKKALCAYNKSIGTGVLYAAPENETEEKLLGIWEQIFENKKIGIDDGFFDLGGHSLKAAVLLTKINKVFGADVTLKDVFKSPTIRSLASNINDAKRKAYFEIEQAEASEYFPVSSAQERMLILDKFHTRKINYNVPLAIGIEGYVDKDKIESFFKLLIKRHEAFRTSFSSIKGEMIQRIADDTDFDFKLSYIKCSEQELEEHIELFIQPFDLSIAPLLRGCLVELSEKMHVLLVDMHHIISDGISMNIVMKEFEKLYRGESLEPLKLHYKDYAVWQKKMLQNPDQSMDRQKNYWVDTFTRQGILDIPMLHLQTDYLRSSMHRFVGDTVNSEVSATTTKNIKTLSSKYGTTLFMTLLASFNILLSKHTGLSDLVVGTPVHGRNHLDLENIVGLFVNTLALRTSLEDQNTFAEYLGKVKENTVEAFDNQDYQFDDLVETLKVQREHNRNPLFDALFTLQNVGELSFEANGSKVYQYPMKHKISKFDLTLTAIEKENKISLSLDYCTELFRRETMECMLQHFIQILNTVADNPITKIEDIDMMGTEEKRAVLVDFNETKTNYPKTETLSALFEAQVERTPENVALSIANEEITYYDLDCRIHQMSSLLVSKGVQRGDIVGIMFDRSIDMIVSLFAVMKVGAAYLPIDPEFPEKRIVSMLNDCQSNVLITHSQMMQDFSENQIKTTDSDAIIRKIITIDKEPEEKTSARMKTRCRYNDIAYVMYTSGSTGIPKGTMTTHYNVSRVVKNTNYIDITSQDTVLQLSNYAFDGSTFDIFGALLNGATLQIIPKDQLEDLSRIVQIIKTRKISVLFITTALFNVFVDMDASCFGSVRKILFGGERVSKQHVGKAFKSMGPGRLVHVYGPTESTVYATYFEIYDYDNLGSTVPIGKPLSNTQVFVLDNNGRTQPLNVPGELYIAGDGLALGYLNRPELTEEKFISGSFIRDLSILKPGQRPDVIYKTGDLVRWLSDGNIEFIDRIDGQVKLRGFRIELGEIENKLLQFQGIKEAVVVVQEPVSGEKQLHAYLVKYNEDENMITGEALKQHLKLYLPEFMIPLHYHFMDKLPLGTNGKIDKNRLPIRPENNISQYHFVAAENDTQKKLVKIWSEILGRDKADISINDAFFDLGGSSISLLRMANRVKEDFNVDISVTDYFNHNTVEKVAERIHSSEMKSENLEVIKFSMEDLNDTEKGV